MKYSITKNTIIVCIVTVLLAGMQSCYYDNEEELYPVAGECDTTNVTYAGTVAPIMANSCNSCHFGNSAPAGVRTDNYTDLKKIADDGRLWGTINHESGYKEMPQGLPKLNDCTLAKIRKWIDDGALNN